MKKDKDITIYSKYCLKCENPEYLLAINMWALTNDLDVKVVRTAYRPILHKKAVRLWASSQNINEEEAVDYPAFVVFDDIYEIKEFVKMITDEKNKMVVGEKTKNDLQRLPKTSRDSRKHRSNRTVSKTKNNNKE